MFVNAAAYRFVDLDRLDERREALRRLGATFGMRGTILLAPEGINLFLSAREPELDAFLRELCADPAFDGLEVKRSASEEIAFRRFRVRIKREIVTFRQPGLRPAARRAATVSASELARWLDAGRDDGGRPIKLLDTRNAFEVAIGGFRGAVDLELRSFCELPEAVAARRDDFAGHRLVTYCTGGIRCEKAALHLADNGFPDVVQLDGGVLRWFEEQGGRHWRGDLFVFDERVAVDPQLRPTSPAASRLER